MSSQDTVASVGTPLSWGAVLSITVTSCVAVAALLAASVAVHVTVVVPIGKVGGASFVTAGIPQLSAATGVPRLTPVAEQLALANTLTAGGAVIEGAVTSLAV